MFKFFLVALLLNNLCLLGLRALERAQNFPWSVKALRSRPHRNLKRIADLRSPSKLKYVQKHMTSPRSLLPERLVKQRVFEEEIGCPACFQASTSCGLREIAVSADIITQSISFTSFVIQSASGVAGAKRSRR